MSRGGLDCVQRSRHNKYDPVNQMTRTSQAALTFIHTSFLNHHFNTHLWKKYRQLLVFLTDRQKPIYIYHTQKRL